MKYSVESPSQSTRFFDEKHHAVNYAREMARDNRARFTVKEYPKNVCGEYKIIQTYTFIRKSLNINPTIPTLNKERGQAMGAGNGRIYLEQTGADTFKIIRVQNALGFKVGVELLREQVELMQNQGYDIDIRAAKVQDD